MEEQDTSEKEASLSQVAAILKAKAYADRGEFIEEQEMDALFEQMLRS